MVDNDLYSLAMLDIGSFWWILVPRMVSGAPTMVDG